jgi:hypothetical protein
MNAVALQPLDIRPAAPIEPEPHVRRFYVDALAKLDQAGVPYVVGGGYAMAYYSGIRRNTKDLDIFVKPEDRDRCLTTLTAGGYRTEFFYPFWIAKALNGSEENGFIDILYGSANGMGRVDDEWISNAIEHEILGYRTRLVPAEEQLYSKSFVQDRDRYDQADVAHLILARGHLMDWRRLLRRFRGHEAVLLCQVILYQYVFPSEREQVPGWVVERLMEAVKGDPAAGSSERICRGTMFCQRGYLPDIHERGFGDARLAAHGGTLTREELGQLPES